MEKGIRKKYLIIVIIISLIFVDQIIKLNVYNKDTTIIEGVLKFTTVENRGGAFGIAQNSIITFIITNIVVLGIIVRFMIIQSEQIDKKTNFALCMILAGGISNLIDRIFRGFVIDFIDISTIINFPKFNLADVYITVGWILLAAFFAWFTYKEIKNKE